MNLWTSIYKSGDFPLPHLPEGSDPAESQPQIIIHAAVIWNLAVEISIIHEIWN